MIASGAFPGALLAALAAAAGGQWTIPDPRTTDHPGARAAPASDPRTYADADGFARRAAATLAALRTNDLSQWRRGWFEKGGDPGKYIPGPAMAMLLANPADPNARKYMNDDRSYREHYHFAAVNWARFYPLFSGALTPEVRRKFSDEAARVSSYLEGPGTENHKVMWYTSALVLPFYIEGDRFAKRSKADAVAHRKAWLRQYVQRLYAAGQGEWDSSTYLMFDLNGMLNVYDFSKDADCRLLAKAALDFYVAAYALKYADGVFCGPNQRGHCDGPVRTISDRTGWLWWGSTFQPPAQQLRGSLHAVAAITSGYRPPRVLCNIAQRRLAKLPFESRDSKPDYWQGTLEPRPNTYRESVYVTRHYTMGTLWNGHGGQITRFQLVAAGGGGPRSVGAGGGGGIPFTGGSPGRSDHTGKQIDFGYADGIGRWDQTCQVGPTHVCISDIPPDQQPAYAFFTLPEAAGKPEQHRRWWFLQAGATYLALYPLGGDGQVGRTTLTEREKAANAKEVEKGRTARYAPQPILIFPGRRTGFVLETADADRYPTMEAFRKAVLAGAAPDTSRLADRLAVSYRTLAGRAIAMRFDDAAGQPAVSIDGKAVSYADWPVYDGPYLKLARGVMTVADGREGFAVDCTGDLPVYKSP